MEIADKVGVYERFSGRIVFDNTHCEVEDASFELHDETVFSDEYKNLSITFRDGRLIGGILSHVLIDDIVSVGGYVSVSKIDNIVCVKTVIDCCKIIYGLLKDSNCVGVRFCDGIFNGGKLQLCVFENGVFKDGVFEDGAWHNGTWESGNWKGNLWKKGFDKYGNVHFDSPDKWS